MRTSTSSPLALLLSASLSSLAAAQGFYDVCSENWTLGFRGFDNFVVDSCPDADGTQHSSFIDLNDCLSNSEGAITAHKSGRALFSCTECSAVANSSSINCMCTTTYRGEILAAFDLNTVLTNNDGILGCFDLPGVELPTPTTTE